ncbi:unnamed protein product [Leptidea sinapis]|uniref:CUB domain-containing protein n=1 Tax=Leptidea sinapis TaxID=189913 RepID=A0A5E4QTP0_9NEOP|nr:unnamed protein product [Leptidea sinapis]
MAVKLKFILLIIAAVGSGTAMDTHRTPRQNGPALIFTAGNGEQCLGSDRSTGGVCLSRNQCNTQGGKAIGFCGVFATCCSWLECSYNVEINNNNVCQMRIDFETFNLAPPTTVTNLQANSDILPPLCGDNNGQHTSFEMAFRDDTNMYLDTDCQTNPVVQGSSQSEDYLFIPEAETADGLRGSKYCGTSASDQIIASTPPGPLYVHFHSDNLVTTDINESGYRFNYNVLNNCYLRTNTFP